MLTQTLQALFYRDLKKLIAEIDAYNSEEKLWHTEANIKNSAGNLCLHLIGNLNTYIAAGIGKIPYVRQRDLEFSLKNIPKEELISKIEEVTSRIAVALDTLADEDLDKEYPLLVFEEPTTTGYMLVHLTTHLSYHLGQINYHRRLLDDN